jgi:hypothetical protein
MLIQGMKSANILPLTMQGLACIVSVSSAFSIGPEYSINTLCPMLG